MHQQVIVIISKEQEGNLQFNISFIDIELAIKTINFIPVTSHKLTLGQQS